MLEALIKEKEQLFKHLNSQSFRGLGIMGSAEEINKYEKLLIIVNFLKGNNANKYRYTYEEPL